MDIPDFTSLSDEERKNLPLDTLLESYSRYEATLPPLSEEEDHAYGSYCHYLNDVDEGLHPRDGDYERWMKETHPKVWESRSLEGAAHRITSFIYFSSEEEETSTHLIF